MLKKINNKGYMLVEIILAFSIAFILLYFIMDLVIKMKNKNDDLLVKTLVYTDQTIVYNGLVELAINNKDEFDCNLLEVDGNVIKYDSDVIDIVSDYAEIDKANYICKDNVANKIIINIPISVKQLPDEDFSIDIDYRYGPNDTESPVCNFSVDSAGKLTAKCYDVGIEDVAPSGIEFYKWNDEEEFTKNEDNSEEITVIKDIDKKEHIITVIDNAGNIGEFTYTDTEKPSCSLTVGNGVISLFSSKDNGSNENDPSGISTYQWNGEAASTSSSTKSINEPGTYTLTINDYAGNSNTCKVLVENATSYCPHSGTPSTACYYNASISYTTDGICYCKSIKPVENDAYAVMAGACSAVSGSQAKCKCLSGYEEDSAQYNDCKVTGGPYYTCNGVSSTSDKCYENIISTCSSGYNSTGNGYCYK